MRPDDVATRENAFNTQRHVLLHAYAVSDRVVEHVAQVLHFRAMPL